MRAYIVFEDGIEAKDHGTVAISFVCLNDKMEMVDQVDVTSEAHKMAARVSMIAGEMFQRQVPPAELAAVAAQAMEAQKLGIVTEAEAQAFSEHGSLPSRIGNA